MPVGKQFWDSNLWIYLFTVSVNPADVAKQSRLLSLLSATPDISISAQVVNEVANVLMQKFKYDEARIELILDHITKSSFFQPLTLAITQKALALK